MVTRIVKMTFRPEACDAFLEIFHRYRNQIRGAEGCRHLTLLREHPNGSVFFTYSKWEHENYLDLYRDSETFGIVWPQVKPLFAAPAEAWTLKEEIEL